METEGFHGFHGFLSLRNVLGISLLCLIRKVEYVLFQAENTLEDAAHFRLRGSENSGRRYIFVFVDTKPSVVTLTLRKEHVCKFIKVVLERYGIRVGGSGALQFYEATVHEVHTHVFSSVVSRD